MDEYDEKAISRLEAMSSVNQETGCLSFNGCLDRGGYGSLQYRGKKTRAHRLKYELLRGPIPPGMVIDHICHDPETCSGGSGCPHRACLNIEHMRVVTHGDNLSSARRNMTNLRGRISPSHCPRGHAYTEENTRYNDPVRKTGRLCRICRNAQCLAAYHKRTQR